MVLIWLIMVEMCRFESVDDVITTVICIHFEFWHIQVMVNKFNYNPTKFDANQVMLNVFNQLMKVGSVVQIWVGWWRHNDRVLTYSGDG